LGVLVARASGTSFATFLAERIFAPLGMTDTGFHVPPAKLDRLASCYRSDAASGGLVVEDPAHGGRFAKPPRFEAGANGLVSTADDFLAFERLLLNGGRHDKSRLISERNVVLMTSDQIPPEQKAASPFFPGFWEHRGWGFGLSVVTGQEDGGPPAGSFGWDGGFCTSAYCHPKDDLIAILLAQSPMDGAAGANLYADFWRSVCGVEA
jgi:CubicO group peptidase (beta-lactamase class C family)